MSDAVAHLFVFTQGTNNQLYFYLAGPFVVM